MLFPCQISKGPTPRIRHCVQVDWQLELKNCIYVWFLMRQFLYSRALISHNLIIIRMQVEKCVKVNGKNKCTTYTQRWSYAIPLEMIYLTRLYNWNPHNIDYKVTCLHQHFFLYILDSYSILSLSRTGLSLRGLQDTRHEVYKMIMGLVKKTKWAS